MENAALLKLSYGLYVVGVKNGDSFGGSIVDALAQVSLGPPAILVVSLMKNSNTNALVKENGEFTVSVLPADVDPFVIANFGFQSSRNTEKWKNVPHAFKDNLPILLDAVSFLQCKVLESKEFETHRMFICEVTDAWMGNGKDPLIYGEYQKSMKTATMQAFTEFKKTGKVSAQKTEKWVCTVCGYEYDGETPFEELPDDWKCPQCFQPKTVFEKREY